MRKRALTTAASFAMLFGAIMLATGAGAVTVAVPSGLRAAAATMDPSQPAQYTAGGAIATRAGATAAMAAAMATADTVAMVMATVTAGMVVITGHTMVDILMPGPVGAIGGAGGDGVGRALSRLIASGIAKRGTFGVEGGQ
jgi:hypothetical protein